MTNISEFQFVPEEPEFDGKDGEPSERHREGGGHGIIKGAEPLPQDDAIEQGGTQLKEPDA